LSGGSRRHAALKQKNGSSVTHQTPPVSRSLLTIMQGI
jgi:hypothetical protein